MKLYRHLAWDGIRKNSRLYVPYLLTGVGAVSFFYSRFSTFLWPCPGCRRERCPAAAPCR